MLKTKPTNAWPDRRQFLRAAAGGAAGLIIGLRMPFGSSRAAALSAEGSFAPNAFVRIAPDNTVTILSKHLEFGQGPFTGLATIIAEELDADWSQMRAEHSPADPQRYNNLFFGPVQGTGGSTAIANSWNQLRRAGAQARAMLVQAAARKWQVAPGEITVESGVLRHSQSDRSATFGELLEDAAQVSLDEEPKLKDPKDFKLIGKRLPKLDTPAKTNGQAVYTLDVERPGMKVALIRYPPRFGARVRSFDDSKTRAVEGVTEVMEIPQGVAVIAEGFWAAKRGREALQVEWDNSQAEHASSERLIARYRHLAERPGAPARNDGEVEQALSSAAQTLQAEYVFPYLAHAPMEPNDCVLEKTSEGVEMWFGSQLQTPDQGAVAKVMGLRPDQVKINTLFAGGSFGRRATPASDMAAEAAEVLKASGGRYPLKVMWTREDDIRGGRYRPLYVHRLAAGLDQEGKIIGWDHTIVGQSIVVGSPFEGMIENGIDPTSVEGARGLPYAIPNLRVTLHTVSDVKVPVLWWRSVGHTHTAYSTETFLDDLARKAGKDPVEWRLKMLSEHPRHAGVLKLAAEKAGWGSPLPEGRARGVAVHESFSSYVAQVVEISRGENGLPRVHKVVCAVDCGIAINPNIIQAQMESGIGFGLGAALYNEIILEDGRVRQSNFHDYWPLRFEEMPEVEVHIVPSGEDPTGVGEPGVPPIAPAVANAWAALTGQSVRRLPFQRSLAEEESS
ncbi:MAG TPA: xanthine dehydrogenase family protein molybdopterin-binding subunit [Acidobacteriota bacterium]|nr:xanthine dehydrogenase family protein molybdopterin-binding subunit [Acidobacteriota bacterium]